MISINTLQNSKVVLETPLGRLLLQNPKCHLVHLAFKPGENIPLHKNPVNVIFYVIYGNGTVTMSNQTLNVKSGDSLYVDKALYRAWHNHSNDSLEVLVIKLME